MESRTPRKPALNGRMLVCGVVISNKMEIFIWWCLLLDQAQEALPIFMYAVRPTCPDYSAVKNRQCGKQCCDAISSFFCVARTSCRRAALALFPDFRDGNQWQLGFLQAAGSLRIS